MKTRFVPLLILAVAASGFLSACATVTYTVAADEIATTAENALEEQVGTRPEIDCGTEDVELKNRKVIDCVLTDPSSGEEFAAPVTLSGVEGTSYTVSVKVADKPIGQ